MSRRTSAGPGDKFGRLTVVSRVPNPLNTNARWLCRCDCGEEVHHLNAVRDDNRRENLELWVRRQPAGARVSDLVDWATEVLRRYSPDRLENE